jgi:IS5 family transposase
VECIGKGKAHKPYEFGCKVTVENVYVDKGYRGHGMDRFMVWISGQKAPLSASA